MQCDRDLDDAEAGTEVAAGLGHGGDDRLADLRGEFRQLRLGEATEVGGPGQPGKDGGSHGRDSLLRCGFSETRLVGFRVTRDLGGV